MRRRLGCPNGKCCIHFKAIVHLDTRAPCECGCCIILRYPASLALTVGVYHPIEVFSYKEARFLKEDMWSMDVSGLYVHTGTHTTQTTYTLTLLALLTLLTLLELLTLLALLTLLTLIALLAMLTLHNSHSSH